MKHLYKRGNYFLWLLIFSLWSVFSYGQQKIFKNGVRQGTVKVKFTRSLSPTLKQLNLNTKGNKLTIGIQSFDKISENVGAINMHRLFPENPNPKLEAKLKKHGLDLWYVVEMNPNEDPAQAARKYAAIGEVQFAEVEKEIKLSNYHFAIADDLKTPNANSFFNDPRLQDQWHYNNIGQTGYTNGAHINLYKAWEITKGSPDIVVSIHDEGVDVKHPDLKDNIWVNAAEVNGKPGVDDDNNGFIDDFNGWNFDKKNGLIDPQTHGTHVAGTVAAVNNNGIGVSGVAGGSGKNDGVKVMSLQSLGGGRIEQSYIYAANNGAVISQNSWGYTSPGSWEKSVQEAIDYFIEEAGDFSNSPMKGGLVIFAAGNSNEDNFWYPGYYDKTISVASVGPDWKKASYSNFGNWVDVSAPGGESMYGSVNGILSTLPNGQYGYLQGTSMACPHVSGVAALALANRNSQLTTEVLKNKILTGVVDIDDKNPDFAGKLGSGSIDAFLAIQNNQGVPPDPVNDLKITGIAQEFANLSWTAPIDKDDSSPVDYRIYYHNQPLSKDNLGVANIKIIKSNAAAGEIVSLTVNNLLGDTNYYFAVIAGDRWNNLSELSNVESAKTNNGPKIELDDASKFIELNLNDSNAFKASQNIKILNQDIGVLRWEFLARHRESEISYWSSKINYPAIKANYDANKNKLAKINAASAVNAPKSAASFNQKEKIYSDYPTNLIGDTDINVTNSSATKFFVDDSDGFNLTQVSTYLKAIPDKGPVIVEIYKGTEIKKDKLVYAQEYLPYNSVEHYAYINLNEQVFFNNGETFWVVFHIPAGNLYPLGIGYEIQPEHSNNSFISFNLGQSWSLLSDAIDSDKFAWNTIARSNNKYLGEYLALDPSSGEVNGNSEYDAVLSADGTALINGKYMANAIIKSNDSKNKEIKIPVTVNVSGQSPKLIAPQNLEFTNTFVGTTKELSFTVKNTGLGNFNDLNLEITNPNFQLLGWAPDRIAADGEINLSIKYSPTKAGNDNGYLIIKSSSNPVVAKLVLFGVGTEPGKISVTPISQSIDNIKIGDQVNAKIKIENIGQASLKYFIPKFDNANFSQNWPSNYNKFGYKLLSNRPGETSTINYEFNDISTTGKNITNYFISDANRYFAVDMGFDFPFYDKKMNKIFISHQGFTTFDDSVNPVNLPALNGAPFSPKGYISLLGTYSEMSLGGNVFYQVDSDKIIIQFSGIGDGWSGTLSAQMVLHADGNIRFYYDQINYPAEMFKYINILIEDFDQTDGIEINSANKEIELFSGMAIGLDYSGPDIIKSVLNPSAVLLPGESAEIDVNLDTSSLSEGKIKKYINIVTSDPFTPQVQPLVELNITDGGVGELLVTPSEINFGDVFQNTVVSRNFGIKNIGNAPLSLSSVSLDNNLFTINGDTNAVIAPGQNKIFEVLIPTDIISQVVDKMTIVDSDNNSHTVSLIGNVLAPPSVIINNLDDVSLELNHGETHNIPFLINNDGLSNLELVATGNDWITLNAPASSSLNLPKFTYNFETFNDGSNYQWLDIREKGSRLDLPKDLMNPEEFWKPVKLPFAFNFYGNIYDQIYLGYNGAVSFHKPEQVELFNRSLPNGLFKSLIAPYWTFAGFDTALHPENQIGVFYHNDTDRFVISWEYFTNYFGGIGDPVSAQLILFKNGTMKFQYKLNGNFDFTSNNTTIGIQNEDQSDVITISANSLIKHGQGLVYVITPAKKHTVTPGNSLAANVNVDARNLFAGNYNGSLKIRTNVPNNENLSKNINLTVLGVPVIHSNVTEFNYGNIFVDPNAVNTKMFDISNTGSMPLKINAIKTESGSPEFLIETYKFFPGWFGGGFWEWTDIQNLWDGFPVILPGEKAKFRITFTPSKAQDLAEHLIVESNASVPEFLIPISASVKLPPVFNLETAEVVSNLNSFNDTDSKNVLFNNNQGESPLSFDLSIDYLRKAPSVINSKQEVIQKLVKAPNTHNIIRSIPADNQVTASNQLAVSNFSRVLAYENADGPETYFGFDGSLPFTVATRFNAGQKGFSLSHIQSYLNLSKVKSGSVNYEIRAGGNSILNAVTIDKGSLSYSYSGSENGAWISMELPEPKGIYPNEDFYVIITYPFDVMYAQGGISGVDNNNGRYMFNVDEKWYDLHDKEAYPGYAWLVRAAESSLVSNDWVSINENTQGEVLNGEAKSVQLNFNAAKGHRGDQHAVLNIRTNDPNHLLAKVPVKLHINEAPAFKEIPNELVKVVENEEASLFIVLNDPENHSFTTEIIDMPDWINTVLQDGKLIVKLKPGYDNAGTYTFKVLAKDQFDAIADSSFSVEVINKNRPPLAKPANVLRYSKLNYFDVNFFNDYFNDPDNDNMTYEITSLANNIASVTMGQDLAKFIVQTHTEGSTMLILKATDQHGAVTEHSINVIVRKNNGPVAKDYQAIVFTKIGASESFKFSQFATDADGDDLTYSLSLKNQSIAKATANLDGFTVLSIENGETVLNLSAKDPFGEIVDIPITVIVNERATDEVTLFPNPVTDFLKIKWGNRWIGNVNVHISNAVGALIKHFEITNVQHVPQSEVDLSGLKSGVYFIKVTGKEGTTSIFKFIKK